MPVVAREKPHGLDACFSIANGRAGFFHSFGYRGPAPEWGDAPKSYNSGIVIDIQHPTTINVKFVFDKPTGPNGVWSIIIPFKAQGSSAPMADFKYARLRRWEISSAASPWLPECLKLTQGLQ